jgi:hypothetical protein
MTHRWRPALLATLFIGSAVLPLHAVPPPAPEPGVTFIGRGLVPGDSLDLSGLKGETICPLPGPDDTLPCIDQATFGGWGSGMTYTGHDNVFLAVPDRGPFDGRTDTPYLDRFHFLHIAIDSAAPVASKVKVTLLDTRFLKNERNQSFVGDAHAFANSNTNTLRLDPESVRVTPDGNFFISDEYGPYVFKFDRQGHLLQRINLPDKYLIANPSGDVDAANGSLELYHANNTSGRQANRGMEGLAITPDGRTLVGLMQNALIQDHALNYGPHPDAPPPSPAPDPPNDACVEPDITDGVCAPAPSRVGFNSRIFTLDLVTLETHEYVYTIDATESGRGQNEIIAVNGHEFLVLERDNRTKVPTPPNGSQAPQEKRLYRIDLNEDGITDVSGIVSLPQAGGAALTAASIKPVTKTLFLDLLNPAYTIDGTTPLSEGVAEKIEAVAWGPDCPTDAACCTSSATTISSRAMARTSTACRRRSTRLRSTSRRRASLSCRRTCPRRSSRPAS